MCEHCWISYDRPDIVNEKTEAAVALVRQVYDAIGGGAGGNLHIVIDDWNLLDHSIEWCQGGRSDPNWHGPPMRWTLTDVEAQCAAAFLGMTLQERVSTLAQFDGMMGHKGNKEN